MNGMLKFKLLLLTLLNRLKEKGFFHIFGASTINKIIGFASSWIIVRILSKPEYGVYTYAYNIYGFIFLFSGLGIISAVLQLGSEATNEYEKRRIYTYGLKFGLLVNFCLAFVILFLSHFIPLKIEGSSVLLTMMAALPLFTVVTDLQFMFLRIHFQNKQFSVLSTINSFAILVFSCGLSFLFKAPGLVLANYCSHLTTTLIAYKHYKVPLRIGNANVTTSERKTILSIALISMVNNGLSHLMYLLDVFVIGIMIAKSEVIASYKIATNIPVALQFIPAALILFVYPHFARNKDNKAWVLEKYRQLLLPFGFFNLLISAFLILISEPLIVFIFGLQYQDAVIPFRILCVSYFFSATFRTVSGSLLITQRQLKFNFLMSFFGGMFNLILNVVLIKSMQSIGAAIATLITTSVCGFISTAYFVLYVKNKKNSLMS